MATEKKKTKHPLLFCKINNLFTLLPHFLSSSVLHKKIGIQILKEGFFGDNSLPSYQSSLPQDLVSWFIDLSCGKRSKPVPGNEVEIIGQ